LVLSHFVFIDIVHKHREQREYAGDEKLADQKQP
jgi:hypothetical protein